MTDKQVDALAKVVAEHVKAGGTIEVIPYAEACPKCKQAVLYRYNGSPNWQNRWTCPKCGRHESR